MAMIDFIGESYRHRSTDVSSQITQNLYPEIIDNSGAKNNYILIGTPGSKLFSDLGNVGICRGLTSVASPNSTESITSTRTFAVFGSKLYEINSDKTYVVRGEFSDQSTRCYFADASTHLIICDSFAMYALELETNVLSTVVLPFEKPTQVIYFKGRVLAINADDDTDVYKNYNKYYWSDLDSPTTWNPLSWNNAKGSADPILSIENRQGDLALFGTTSYECWRYTGNFDSPFSLVTNSSSIIAV